MAYRDFEIAPTGSTYGSEDRTIGEWTAEWWKWAVALPDEPGGSDNALEDTSGVFAYQGDVGEVFFVAGTLGGEEVERFFAVPQGTPLLVPLLSASVALPIAEKATPEQKAENLGLVQETLDFLVAHASRVHLSIDDRTVIDEDPDVDGGPNPALHYEESPVFSYGIFEEREDEATVGFQNGFFTDADGNPPAEGDVLTPVDAAGWWTLITDLSPGYHKIEFGGEFTLDDGTTFSTEVVDHILVLPQPLYEVVEFLHTIIA
ncbi:hypothetical protein ACFQX4_25500 [Roseomonas sp. GCM10028921]